MADLIVHLDYDLEPLERHGAWIDLPCSKDIWLREGDTEIIPLGVQIKMPDGYEGLIAPRSSTFLRYGIIQANSIGIIENDYCGPNDDWGMVVWATRDVHIPRGTRIAQFRLLKSMDDISIEYVDAMPFPNRGGYGSTGR
jgi:dUTP pyrophosphatase